MVHLDCFDHTIPRKLNRCFAEEMTRRPDEASIVRAIISLAHSQHLNVIADDAPEAVMTLTPPSTTSTPALYLSNWQNLVGIWKAAKLSQIDPTLSGPRLAELHYLGGSQAARAVNQI